MTPAPVRERTRRKAHPLAAPAAVGLGVLAAWTAVAVVDPNEPGHYPACPLLRLTGLACPLCGGLRAAHDLAHGRVLEAADHNLLFVAALPVLLVLFLRWTAVRARGSTRPLVALTGRWVPTVLAVAVLFGALRNAPGVNLLQWLAP